MEATPPRTKNSYPISPSTIECQTWLQLQELVQRRFYGIVPEDAPPRLRILERIYELGTLRATDLEADVRLGRAATASTLDQMIHFGMIKEAKVFMRNKEYTPAKPELHLGITFLPGEKPATYDLLSEEELTEKLNPSQDWQKLQSWKPLNLLSSNTRIGIYQLMLDSHPDALRIRDIKHGIRSLQNQQVREHLLKIDQFDLLDASKDADLLRYPYCTTKHSGLSLGVSVSSRGLKSHISVIPAKGPIRPKQERSSLINEVDRLEFRLGEIRELSDSWTLAKTLSDPTRRDIMQSLIDGHTLTSRGLARTLGISQQLAYHHLQTLISAGLVYIKEVDRSGNKEVHFYASTLPNGLTLELDIAPGKEPSAKAYPRE